MNNAKKSEDTSGEEYEPSPIQKHAFEKTLGCFIIQESTEGNLIVYMLH